MYHFWLDLGLGYTGFSCSGIGTVVTLQHGVESVGRHVHSHINIVFWPEIHHICVVTGDGVQVLSPGAHGGDVGWSKAAVKESLPNFFQNSTVWKIQWFETE